MRNWIKNSILFLLLVIATIGKSQTYPVNSFVTISPPYSSYLPDYSDPSNNQFKILLTLTDFAVPSYQVKLRIRINGNGYSMVTTDITNQIPITLTPGIPVEITGSDLAPYLASQNLTFEGLSFNEYETSKVLPGGPAMICVDVIDHNSANQTIIGNPACATHWFEKYDPPLINLPLCGSEITPTLPQQILFSWTPLSGASQNLFQTNYEFELWGPFDPGMDPNQIVNQTLPFYSEVTNNSILSLGGNIPDLQVGKMYVWRVTASDISGRDLYVNNGMTEVCHFVYGNVASSILGNIELELNSNGTAKRQGKAWWNVSSDLESYVLELRKTGDQNYDWFPYSTTEGELKINNLEPETEYECRVKGMLGGNATEWSNTSVFTTLPNEQYVCGSNALPPSSQNMVPLDFLMPTNIVQVGQFEMEVTAADGTGTPGHFYGYGKINIPFMYINLNVEFDDLLIDENFMARGGQVDAITEGVDAWLESQSTEYVDGTVESIDFNTEDSTVVVYLEDGEPLIFDWPTDGPITIVDDSGLIYTINPDGTVTITGAITWDNDNLDATANHQVIFKAAPDQTYGFDELIYAQWTENYPCIKLSDNSKYFVPWKSVGASETDKLIAVVIDSSDNPISNPTFVDEFGGQIAATSLGNNKWELDLGIQTGLSKRVYAYDNQGKKVGKFNLIIYASENKDLVVVPVNGAAAPDQATLEADMNNIFDQAYTFFTVDKKDNWTFDYDVNNDGLDLASDNDNDLDRYSEEMKSIRDAYFEAHPDANKNAYYLFVIPEFSDPGQLGYMVRGKALGFIKAGASNKTYAHELGHALTLEHTFPQIGKAQTNNLMDYSDQDSSIHLTAVQWDALQEFNFALSFLDNVEDGSIINLIAIEDVSLAGEDDGPMILIEEIAGNLISSDLVFRLKNGLFFQFKPEDIKDLEKVTLSNGIVTKVIKNKNLYKPVQYSYKKTDTKIQISGEEGYFTQIKEKKSSRIFMCLADECKDERISNTLTHDGTQKVETVGMISADFVGLEYLCPVEGIINICSGTTEFEGETVLATSQVTCDFIETQNEENFCQDNLNILDAYIPTDLSNLIDKMEAMYAATDQIFGHVNYSPQATNLSTVGQLIDERYKILKAIRGYNPFMLEIKCTDRNNKYSDIALDQLAQAAVDEMLIRHPGEVFILHLINSASFKNDSWGFTQEYKSCVSVSFAYSGKNDLMPPGWSNSSVREKNNGIGSFMSAFSAMKKPIYIHNIYESVNFLGEQFISNISDENGNILFDLAPENDIYGMPFIAQANSFISQKKSDYDQLCETAESQFEDILDLNENSELIFEDILNSYVVQGIGDYAAYNYLKTGDVNVYTQPSELEDGIDNLIEILLGTLKLAKSKYEENEPEMGIEEGWLYEDRNYHKLRERTLLVKEKTLGFYLDSPNHFIFNLEVYYSLQNDGLSINDYYDFDGIEEFVDPVIYGFADVVSVVGSPFGLDWIGEGIGLAYASIRGHGFMIALYSASLVIPFVPLSALKAKTYFVYAVKKGSKNLKHSDIVVKKVGELGTDYVAISGKMGYTSTSEAIIAMNKSKHNFDLIKIEKSLVNSADDLLDAVYNTQKGIISKYKSSISEASRNAKGVFGEVATDVKFTEQGFEALHVRKGQNGDLLDGWGESGLDHVYKKDGKYYIVDSKYGSAKLNNSTMDGPQMGDDWISGSNRLNDAVGNDLAEDILDSEYIRIVSNVSSDGTIVMKELDEFGQIIGDFNF